MYLSHFLWLLPWFCRPFEMDIPDFYKTQQWKVGDNITFQLTNNITATSKIQYVNEDGTFLSGLVYPIPTISNTTGVLSAGFYRHPCVSEYASVSASNCETTINANFQFSNNIIFQLTATPSGKYQIKRMNFTLYNESGLEEETDIFIKEKTSVKKLQVSNSKRPVLRILVLYTKQAVQSASGENNILAIILLAAGNFNLTLLNSGINASVEYVAERIPNYNTFIEDDSMGVTLTKMGGSISTSRRYILGCHAVHLLTSQTTYCGIANYDSNGFSSGYSVSMYGCSGGYNTFTHEIGHNIGLHHDSSVYNGPGFNKGYCWDDPNSSGCHRSVMSYPSCRTPLGRSNCDRVQMFSNGETLDMGVHVGITGYYDNAQQYRNNIWNFMNQFTPYFTVPPPPIIQPTFEPAIIPTIEPTQKPTFIPTAEPAIIPTAEPTQKPTFIPTAEPTFEPTFEPTVEPTAEPTVEPTFEPTAEPTFEPTFKPTVEPTFKPTFKPTIEPTFKPTVEPTNKPTKIPTIKPTFKPSRDPTFKPTKIPTFRPSVLPTFIPTFRPSKPTIKPTYQPSLSYIYTPFKSTIIPSQGSINCSKPELCLTSNPTLEPTFGPTLEPTFEPTLEPTSLEPTFEPTFEPTLEPTSLEPTFEPTEIPSYEPTEIPSYEPTGIPSYEPTEIPSYEPTEIPSYEPTGIPSYEPTEIPSYEPTEIPSYEPTGIPSYEPTGIPSYEPTGIPSYEPTGIPSYEPTRLPSYEPTGLPSYEPTGVPSYEPTGLPSYDPTSDTIVINSLALSNTDNTLLITVSTVLSIALFCVICFCIILYLKRLNDKKKQRRLTGNIMFNTVYDPGKEQEEYNNDYREKLQSANPIRLGGTRMIQAVQLEQENISNEKIMRTLFQDVEEGTSDDSYDKTLIKKPEDLNDEFSFSNDELFPNKKNSMRYIINPNADTRFYEDEDMDI